MAKLTKLDFGVPNEIQKRALDEFRSGKRIVLINSGRQAGKMVDINTPIPTPDGFKLMADIQPGDLVFDETGTPTKVTWVSGIEVPEKAYRISFDDGNFVDACSEHEWVSYTKRARKSLRRSQNPLPPEQLTTQQMYESQIYGGDSWANPRTGRRREANHAIKTSDPAQYPEKELPIAPYVLGAWLGDGSSSTGQLTGEDDEIFDRIRSLGYEVTGNTLKGANTKTLTIRGIVGHLRDLEVLRNKHIPPVYMFASVSQRMELLKGLMDTDGWAKQNSGTVEFYASNEVLAHQVRELVESLGFKARLKSKEARLNGVSYGLTYRVIYNPDVHVFHLTRKKARQVLSGRLERDFRYIHSIEPITPVPMKCISVEAESHQYLCTTSYIPTHNSHFGARWLITQTMNPNDKFKLAAAIAPTYRMARVLQRKIEEVLKTDPNLWRKITHRKQPIPTYQFPNGWLIEVHSSDDPDSLRGPTFSAVWYDEVAKGSKESFDILMPTLLAAKGSFLGTTTPRGKQNWIYDTLYLKSCPPGHPDYDETLYNPAYATITGSTWDNAENLSIEAVQQLEDQYGKGSIFGRQEVGGEFVSYEGLVYEWDEVNYIPVNRLPPMDEFSQVIGGIDFGWTDPAAAYVLGYKDGVWHVIDGVYESRLEPNDFAVAIGDLGERYRVTRWYADSARPDAIADLNSRGLPVLPVVKPKIEDRIREMAMFADNYRLKVSHRCPDVKNELQSYQYPDGDRLLRDKNRNPVDRNNHSLDAIGYAIWSVRYLWRNDASYKIKREGPPKDDDDEKSVLKIRGNSKERGSGSTAGLYGT